MKIKISKSQWEKMGKTAGWLKIAQLKSEFIEPQVYTYHINLNERGSFYADVRDSAGKTVFEIKDGFLLKPDESSIFEDGWMKNMHDMDGLKQYLVNLGIMDEKQTLKDMQPRER